MSTATWMDTWPLTPAFLLRLLALLMQVAYGQTTNAFQASLEQVPAVISSPGLVTLRCRFDLRQGEFGSVIWSRGEAAEEVYAETRSQSAVGTRYEHVVERAQSGLNLTPDGSTLWSEANLTLNATCCLRGVYMCLVTDIYTQQSEEKIELTFKGPLIQIIFNGTTFSGDVDSNKVVIETDISSHHYHLAGHYEACGNASSISFSVSPSGGGDLKQGFSQITADGDCNHVGETADGGVLLDASWNKINYAVVIDDVVHQASVIITSPGLASWAIALISIFLCLMLAVIIISIFIMKPKLKTLWKERGR